MTSANPPGVEVSSLRITYPGQRSPLPDGVTFTVRPGETILLLGPSGSGKSTLTLALNGLIPQAVDAAVEGTVLVGGLDASATPVGKLSEHVGMVFQDPDAQIITGTLLDEVCFGPENLLVDADEVLRRAEEALRAVGLWERRADSPDVLSGGGRQRLAIACALAMRTAVLVLDEPTANLDPAGVEEVYAVLRRLVAERRHSIVLVEHDLDHAVEIIDRVVVLDHTGKVVRTGPAKRVLADGAEELLRLGVWLPNATMAALHLREAGVRIEPVPLTPRELATALDALPALPAPPPPPPEPDRAADTAITVRGLGLTRDRSPVLHGIDLDVRAGSVLAIVGTNGAGKTTLLQAIAGILRPPKRSVRVAGLDPATASAKALSRTIGYVFQNPEHQFVRATVADELAHSLRVLGRGRDETDARVDEMLDRLGLTEHRDLHPFELSGGQKRRLSVGTQLITDIRILALDEPTYGQDRGHAAELLELLAKLNADGVTLLMVTHDLQLVADHATDIAVLHRGGLLTCGPAAEVLAGDDLLTAGLRRPPLATAMRDLRNHPDWRRITRHQDLPGRPA